MKKALFDDEEDVAAVPSLQQPIKIRANPKFERAYNERKKAEELTRCKLNILMHCNN